ncbi:MAG: hypothetical protein JF597_11565 [Streptomyces sp.]|uniref:hypothetical protein n=1 Tax=Streptomyces sp. TaxID=1931 RepID=UPI0025D1DA49|nr:hypothetical protein [Streptomyces sp.]MBW8794203.1 hypothetical protein [Streptomyces sp.]
MDDGRPLPLLTAWGRRHLGEDEIRTTLAPARAEAVATLRRGQRQRRTTPCARGSATPSAPAPRPAEQVLNPSVVDNPDLVAFFAGLGVERRRARHPHTLKDAS